MEPREEEERVKWGIRGVIVRDIMLFCRFPFFLMCVLVFFKAVNETMSFRERKLDLI